MKPEPVASSVPVDTEKLTEQDEWKPKKEEWLIMATMAVSSLLVALDSTILVPVLPTLAVALHGTAQETFWAGTSYLLANSVFQPLIASVSDVFGRRELLIPSILLFLVGSIICGVARDFTALLAGRVIQGVGGGGIVTLAQLVYADIVPLRQRPKYFSIVLGAWAAGTVLGPLIGGALVQYSTWRWCFYINIPICGAACAMAVFSVRLTVLEISLREKLVQIDWTGNFVFISSLTSFLVALSWGGVQYSWSSWQTLVPLIIGLTGIILTALWQKFGAKYPFLRRSLFANLSAVCSYFCATLQGVALYMALYYAPFYAIAVLGKSPLGSGVFLLPALCCLLPGSAVVSALITRLGVFRWAIWIGWGVGTIGAGLFILFDADTPKAVWATALAIFGVGMGMVLSSINFSVQAVVDTADAGWAASMYAFTRALGMSLGVAVGGTVFQNFMRQKLVDLGLDPTIAVHAEAYVVRLKGLNADERQLIMLAYVHGFKGIWEVMTGICGVALIIGCGIKHSNLDKMLDSKFQLKR